MNLDHPLARRAASRWLIPSTNTARRTCPYSSTPFIPPALCPIGQRTIHCRILTPAQPDHPAASLRDFLSGAYSGRLVTSHFNWLPRIDGIAGASEKLILKFNPSWLAADFDGAVAPVPDWTPTDVVLEGFFWFDVDVPFDRRSWRGRIRASRGIGASLPPAQVQAFDKEHAALLDRIAPEMFTIKHRVDARILRFP